MARALRWRPRNWLRDWQLRSMVKELGTHVLRGLDRTRQAGQDRRTSMSYPSAMY
jgi:hypothetical protein